MKRNYHAKSEHPQKSFCYCSGKPKIVYASRELALTERNKTFKRTLHLRTYRCPRTLFAKAMERWHLTSQKVGARSKVH